MKVAILLLVALFALVSCNPTISDDYAATVHLYEEHDSHFLHFYGYLYEDYTDKKQRIDTFHEHENHTEVEFLRLYATKLEYENTNNATCVKRALNRTMVPSFDWLAKAKQAPNGCESRNVTGVFWVFEDGDFQHGACVDSTNQNVPRYLEQNNKQRRESRRIYFQGFTAGTPSANSFSVPSIC